MIVSNWESIPLFYNQSNHHYTPLITSEQRVGLSFDFSTIFLRSRMYIVWIAIKPWEMKREEADNLEEKSWPRIHYRREYRTQLQSYSPRDCASTSVHNLEVASNLGMLFLNVV